MRPLLISLLLLAAAPAGASARRIILIGDSHTVGIAGVGGFGEKLVELIGQPGGRVVEVFAACSSAPSWFLPGRSRTSTCGTWFRRWNGDPPVAVDTRSAAPAPAITTLVDDNVALVIIALGTNMANWRQGGVGPLHDAGELARQAVIRGARCVWVGPPPVRGYSGLSDAARASNQAALDSGLADAVRGLCAYVQSTTLYDGSDGIHYAKPRAEQWAHDVHNDPTFDAVMSVFR